MNWNDKIQVFNEDCMITMARYEDNYFDLAVVDPPYGLNIANSPRIVTDKGIKGKSWDNDIPNKQYFDELFRVSKNQIIWGWNYFVPYLTSCKCYIVWNKHQPAPSFADCETAWTSFNKPAMIVDLPYYGNIEGRTKASKKIHPTQKPISLYYWIYERFADCSFKIIDTHLGSGTNAIAANKFGVSEFVGIEKDKDYFYTSFDHFKEKTSQLVFF